MKTRTQKAQRHDADRKPKPEPVFYVIGSSMNDNGDDSNENDQQASGYPDFYEDTDNMNRYLW